MKHLDFTVKKSLSKGLRIFVCQWVLLAVFGMVDKVHAVEVKELYQGEVIVQSRDNERERLRGFADALRQVLVKITGNRQVLDLPQIRRGLSVADDYVDTWSYQALDNGDGNTDQQPGIAMSVNFFEPEVLSLLDSAGVPLWPGNRPYTLIWMVIQDELGERQLVGANNDDFRDVMGIVDQLAAARGLPILLPILDLEDRRALSVGDVWDMHADNLLEATSRYQSESVLVMRIFRSLNGEIYGRGNYLFRNQVLELESFESDMTSFITDSVDLAARELSAYYAVLLSGTESSMEVNLTVTGISTVEDYAGLLGYVGQLTDVNNVQVAAINQETVQLKLVTGGQLRQLVETIALNRNLVPSSELVRNDNLVHMNYQWVH
jgi:hypothetical protein